jgi:hypothetical protein
MSYSLMILIVVELVGASICPIADFDPNVRSVVISFDGQYPGATASFNPTFTIEYRALVD